MSNNKNELSINVTNSKDVSIKNIEQTLESREKDDLKKEIEEILRLLRLPSAEKQQLADKLDETKKAIDQNKPKSQISKILGEAGSFLKDFAKEAGKTAISALIKSHM